MEARLKEIEHKLEQLVIHISQLDNEVTKVQSDLDEHLLEHMIEDRNKEFRFNYPYDEE